MKDCYFTVITDEPKKDDTYIAVRNADNDNEENQGDLVACFALNPKQLQLFIALLKQSQSKILLRKRQAKLQRCKSKPSR